MMTVNKPHRITLVAGYDDRNMIHDYTIFLLESLSKISDVYYMSAAEMPDDQLAKLDGIAKWAGAYRHGRYDFGSWGILIEKLGWDEISRYDELLLVNDSIYGPMFDLEPICQAMTGSNCDFWGMTANGQIDHHLQSYFLSFKKSVLADPAFREFWIDIEKQENHNQIVEKYEIGLSKLLTSRGYKSQAIAPAFPNYINPTTYPTKLLALKIPFVKVKCFKARSENLREEFCALETAIKQETEYDFSLIERHLGKNLLDKIRQEEKNFVKHLYWRFKFIDIYTTPKMNLKFRIFGIKFLSIPLNRYIIKKLSNIYRFKITL